MTAVPKILLVDDEQDFLDLFEETLAKLPSQPEILTCKSGPAALAFLESEAFSLLISDLHMPDMDGLEVLSLVRRQYPDLRIIVMTALVDELERGRAYALGADLFWQKPANQLDVELFQNCIESLLNRAEGRAHTPVRSRSIQDVLNWERAARRSSRMNFRQGRRRGTVWISNGELIDAETGGLRGTEALWELLSWGAAEFEIFASEPRMRSIFESPQAVFSEDGLLNAGNGCERPAHPLNGSKASKNDSGGENGMLRGVEFVHAVPERKIDEAAPEPSNPDQLAAWMLQTQQAFQELGRELDAGELKQLEGLGPDRHVAMVVLGEFTLCAGFNRAFDVGQVRSTLKHIVTKWVS
jgi:CheY-like chemotaxis protein